MFENDDSLFNALTSLNLFTSSIELYKAFIHFIATNSPLFNDWALKTSLNVPSPNFFIILYSIYFEKLIFLKLTIHFFFLFWFISFIYFEKNIFELNGKE